MIPVLQFDPASQTLWYDTHLLNRSRGAPEIGRALELAIIGDDSALQSHIKNIDDTWVQTRSVNIASAIWHEKRHFLDFMLTNYGAFRMRQFFIMYANTLSVISEASKLSELLVPVQSYLNASICNAINVAPAPEPIKVFARDVRNRKIMLQDDRDPVQSRFGKIEIGGEALFESIAHFVQTGKVHRVFGREYNARIQRDVPDASLNEDRYWWAVKLMTAAGLLDMSVSDEVDESGYHNALVHDPPFLPICYAAPACRLWKQEQKYAEDASSYLTKI
jgi:hypothetical protein